MFTCVRVLGILVINQMEFELGSFLSVILSLLVLEVLLSIDNALVNVSIARKLPKDQQASAVRLGIIFAAGFRVIALLLAALIIDNVWIKVLGALYLLYLMFDHLGTAEHKTDDTPALTTYKKVVMRIALADIVFSIDNVISAVGISENITYVITGVLIGIAAILLMSRALVKIIDDYPHLAVTGYLAVGFIGTTMLLEQLVHWHIGPHIKFIVIVGMASMTVLYERKPKVQKLLKPSVLKAQMFFRIPGSLFRLLFSFLKRG